MIAIIDTGCANINSVKFAFERLNITPKIITSPEQMMQFDRVILPGVGHAKVAMQRLVEGGWQQAISEYQKPLLGICLGMQLLCDYSDEGELNTLGHIPGKVTHLNLAQLPTPHMGWNNLDILKPHPLTQGISQDQQVYFVHSFAHEINSNTLVSAKYGTKFSAIVAKDNFAGMQFHPERSAKVGAQLLNNFLNWKC